MNNLNYQDKKKIIQRYADILHDLDMDDSLLKVIDDTLEEIISTLKDKPLRLYDAILSCGENFNAQLIASYNDSQGFKTTYLSPKDAGILVTDLPQQAQILEEAYEKISKLKDIEGKIIIPGFFGVSKMIMSLRSQEVVLTLQVQSLLEELEHLYMKTSLMYQVFIRQTLI